MLSHGYKSILTALAYDKHFDLSNWVGKERKRINKIKKDKLNGKLNIKTETDQSALLLSENSNSNSNSNSNDVSVKTEKIEKIEKKESKGNKENKQESKENKEKPLFDIVLNEEIHKIRWTDKRDSKYHNCDACLITISLGVLQSNSIQFEPKLPIKKQEAIDSFGFGNLNKTNITISL